MSRLIVSIGTSLFHSASWLPQGPFAAIAGYGQWSRVASPEERRAWSGERTTGAVITSEIRRRILNDPEDDAIINSYDFSFEVFGQYSAEISTLLAMRTKLKPHLTVKEFLAEYSSVVFLHGGASDDTSFVARHLHAAFVRLGVRNIQQYALDGESLADRLQSLIHYLGTIGDAPADLVASGGYKAFAIAMAHFYWQRRDERWRLFYLHEADDGALIQEWQPNRAPTLEISSPAGQRTVVIKTEHM